MPGTLLFFFYLAPAGSTRVVQGAFSFSCGERASLEEVGREPIQQKQDEFPSERRAPVQTDGRPTYEPCAATNLAEGFTAESADPTLLRLIDEELNKLAALGTLPGVPQGFPNQAHFRSRCADADNGEATACAA